MQTRSRYYRRELRDRVRYRQTRRLPSALPGRRRNSPRLAARELRQPQQGFRRMTNRCYRLFLASNDRRYRSLDYRASDIRAPGLCDHQCIVILSSGFSESGIEDKGMAGLLRIGLVALESWIAVLIFSPVFLPGHRHERYSPASSAPERHHRLIVFGGIADEKKDFFADMLSFLVPSTRGFSALFRGLQSDETTSLQRRHEFRAHWISDLVF